MVRSEQKLSVQIWFLYQIIISDCHLQTQWKKWRYLVNTALTHPPIPVLPFPLASSPLPTWRSSWVAHSQWLHSQPVTSRTVLSNFGSTLYSSNSLYTILTINSLSFASFCNTPSPRHILTPSYRSPLRTQTKKAKFYSYNVPWMTRTAYQGWKEAGSHCSELASTSAASRNSCNTLIQCLL